MFALSATHETRACGVIQQEMKLQHSRRQR